jgi:hypothetical protein
MTNQYGEGRLHLYTERHLLWSRHFVTRSPLAVAARNTFSRQLQTNFESFPNNCCISRDCRLTGYFIINMWRCCLLFELPCISRNYFRSNECHEQGTDTRVTAEQTSSCLLFIFRCKTNWWNYWISIPFYFITIIIYWYVYFNLKFRLMVCRRILQVYISIYLQS